MEFLEQILGDKFALVVTVLMVFNVVATAIVKILEIVKKPLSENHIAYKVLNFVQKAIDTISANKQHK